MSTTTTTTDVQFDRILSSVGINESYDDCAARTLSTPVDANTRVRRMVLAWVIEVAATEDDLTRLANSISSTLTSVVRGLPQGRTPSASGEVQGAAVKFDVACARLAEQRKALKTLASLLDD